MRCISVRLATNVRDFCAYIVLRVSLLSISQSPRLLSVDDMNLNGALPSEISLLSGLTTLSLSRNSFTGHLPSELGALGNLTFLDLEQNRFSGRIPSHLIDTALGPAARNLFHLDLSTNIFSSSTIPTELTSMSNLEYLGLNAAGIVGSIPSEIFQLTKLGKF